ncbi:DUF5703 domain-containing protein [Flagellimonas sp. 2504JD4-2]
MKISGQKNVVVVLLILFTVLSCSDDKPMYTDAYNVVWSSPSDDHSGSMPIGNGDIGLNTWVEKNGDVSFYIGKLDSWGDNGRLLKVGKIRVQSNPPIVFPGADFRQELDLKSGTVKISSIGKINGEDVNFGLDIWVDANQPVIQLKQRGSIPVELKTSIEMWRTSKDTLPEINVSDFMEDPDAEGFLREPVIVEPDKLVASNGKDYIGWYHHNAKSAGFNTVNELQGMLEYVKEDPILHRTFGALISGKGSDRVNDSTLISAASMENSLQVCVLTKHPSSPSDWINSAEDILDQVAQVPYEKSYAEHEKWWKSFWNRSWIRASKTGSVQEPSNDAFLVSRAYHLQRFINASAGRADYPIKFNGSIFTVPAEGKVGGPDYRRWGPGYWWQNTRLPYLGMCASGDFDLMQPLFKMYAGDVLEYSKYRTKKYFGFEGAYFPECMYFWGANFPGAYGWTPFEEREDKLQESGWHKWEWVAGPEFVFMMLDYYDYTGDKGFLQNKIVPTANEIIRFFDNYYQTNDKGVWVMYPSMAAETWWDCTNPMTEIAGLHGIIDRLMALPEDLTKREDRAYWQKVSQKLPSLPLHETPSGTALAPADRFENKRNSENPELYAVFPFRQYGVGRPNIEYGKNALEHRLDKGAFGWRQDDIFMAYLGLTEQAREYLVERAENYDENSRFPAFWGPNYDWTPDQDHGGVLMKSFQSMLMQVDPYSEKIYLMPAWPKEWDAEFKLHAPYNTIIEGEVKNGELVRLAVDPPERGQDIVLLPKSPN